MVDFKKKLAKKGLEKQIDPAQMYERLDRASDKGPLRPAQSAILDRWHSELRDTKDVIVKLHTGQGKTLVGLLMLQSKLNETEKPALYVCPNRFLVNQTVEQASQFGVNTVTVDDDLPTEFLDGKTILVTHVQKAFNGLTKFGLGPNSVSVGTILIDDAHACIDSIRASCVITLDSTHQAYSEIVDLFAPDLEDQGVGTFADIRRHSFSALLPVPYWAWRDRTGEVAGVLSKYAKSNEIKFAWPLLKDMLADCLCIVSGKTLEIAPYQPPLHRFGSYHKAGHRIFMSATVTDDSFLIKGLGLAEDVVNKPLVYEAEKWAGEKMVLIPSLIDPTLQDSEIVEAFAKPKKGRKYGVVVLVPSFDASRKWEATGAVVAKSLDLENRIEMLRNGNCTDVLTVANRYDGIDLPDDSCRILILDSKPFAEGLATRYLEVCREGSSVVATRTARSIEQGLGRAVRGEKDYCVILLIGPNLVKAIRSKESRKFLSSQTRTQIEIGLQIVDLAKDEISEGTKPLKVLDNLVQQCLQRDVAWKEYYVEQMTDMTPEQERPKALHFFSAELSAEHEYAAGAYDEAASIIQKVIDEWVDTDTDRGWYLQEMARYRYPKSKDAANKLQVAAHNANRLLLKPQSGMVFAKMAVVSQKRVESIVKWVRGFESYNDLLLAVEDLCGNLRFGVRADDFESAFNLLASALGFQGQRPDREWKEGPDNLWALRDDLYWLVECKSEVQTTRKYIQKDETTQMNSASTWFAKRYPGAKVSRAMIIPARELGPGSVFQDEVGIVTDRKLSALIKNIRSFFSEFAGLDLQDLSEPRVLGFVQAHALSVDDLVTKYVESPKG
jgi:replicative superfamily II helicase